MPPVILAFKRKSSPCGLLLNSAHIYVKRKNTNANIKKNIFPSKYAFEFPDVIKGIFKTNKIVVFGLLNKKLCNINLNFR